MLEERCADRRSELERIDDQHKLLHDPMDAARPAVATWKVAPSAETAQAVIDSITAIAEVSAPTSLKKRP